MAYNNSKYVILTTTEIDAEDSVIDFSQLSYADKSHCRKNNDGTKSVVKFKGDTPSFLTSKTIYTHEEIIERLRVSSWNPSLNPEGI